MSSSIKCDFCSKNLKNKYTLIRHIENLHPNIEEKKLFQTIEKIKGTKTFSERCSGCGQNFISSSHLKKHQENCDRFSMIDLKNKIESLENIEDLQLIRKIIDCKYQNIKGIGTGSLNTTINAEGVTSHNINNAIGSSFNMGNTNSNNTNNIINNITVMNLGHENTDPIEEREFFFGILNQEVDLSDPEDLSNTLVTLFKKLQLNKDYPENHNLYVSNSKPYKPFYVFENDKWNQEKMKDYDKYCDIANDCLDRLSQIINFNHNRGMINYMTRMKINHQIEQCMKQHGDKIFKLTARKLFQNTYQHRNIVKPTYQKSL